VGDCTDVGATGGARLDRALRPISACLRWAVCAWKAPGGVQNGLRPSGAANFIGHLRRSDVTAEPDMSSAYATHSASISMIPLRHPSATVRRYGLWTVNNRAAVAVPSISITQNDFAIARPPGPLGGQHLRGRVDIRIVPPKRG
jgi:hypothetical protein